MSTRTKPDPVLINGKKIHLRTLRNIVWGIVIGTLIGASLIAGGYFNFFQVHWFVHIGPLYWRGFSLKLWWDEGMNIFKSKSWILYRHGLRDDGESALSIMIALTVMAKAKYWNKTVGKAQLYLTPPLMVILAGGMIAGAVWLQFFGLPNAWHAAFSALGDSHYRIYDSALASVWALAETIAFGFVVSHLLRPLWAPVGAHIQGELVDRMVDRWWVHKCADAVTVSESGEVTIDPEKLKLPYWVRHHGPPVLRERFAKTVTDDLTPDENGNTEAEEVISSGTTRKKRDQSQSGWWHRVLFALKSATVTTSVLFIVYLVVTGLIAKYWIAKGHSVPYLAPASLEELRLHVHAVAQMFSISAR